MSHPLHTSSSDCCLLHCQKVGCAYIVSWIENYRSTSFIVFFNFFNSCKCISKPETYSTHERVQKKKVLWVVFVVINKLSVIELHYDPFLKSLKLSKKLSSQEILVLSFFHCWIRDILTKWSLTEFILSLGFVVTLLILSNESELTLCILH